MRRDGADIGDTMDRAENSRGVGVASAEGGLMVVLCALGCATEPDLVIDGQTRVFIEANAEPRADIIPTIRKARAAVRELYGRDDVFDTDLHLISWWKGREFEIAGQFFPPRIIYVGIDVADLSVNTALLHEYIEHRLPYVLTGDFNAEHAPEWIAVHEQVRKRISE